MWSIVHVLSSYGVGGQERVALDLAIGQRARGHRVSVISLAPAPDGAMADEFAAAGIAVGRVEKRGAGLDPTLLPRQRLVAGDVRRNIEERRRGAVQQVFRMLARRSLVPSIARPSPRAPSLRRGASGARDSKPTP